MIKYKGKPASSQMLRNALEALLDRREAELGIKPEKRNLSSVGGSACGGKPESKTRAA